jgi:acyl dehydratase
VAPRDFNPFAWMTLDARREPWLRGMGTTPGTRVLNGGQRSRYFAPIRPGDVITSIASLANAYEREGKLDTMLFLVNETRWTNQDGRLVRVGNRTTIYY